MRESPKNFVPSYLWDRRWFLKNMGRLGALAYMARMLPSSETPLHAQETNALLADRPLVRYPEKTDLILLTSRPPQLETPIKYFESAITPNDAFYVRYHIPPPTAVDLSMWRLKIGGHVERPLELSIEDLQTKFKPVKLVAVNQCSGNSRGTFAPRVFGGQWANGAMGNAEWTGISLRDILITAGIKEGAVDVSFNGLDRPAMPTVPDFVKSLGVTHILDDPNVLIAYQMNGKPLPMLNGFPARLIVPGWYATYWVKNLSEITVLDKEFDGFWMRKSYLIPATSCGCVEPGTTPTRTVPINRMDVRSFIVFPHDGAELPASKATTLKGIAFDAGSGIQQVLVSADSGNTWKAAQLGDDYGKYSFREWTFRWTPPRKGMYRLMVRATNRVGESQPAEPLWNPSGYLRNVIEHVDVKAA